MTASRRALQVMLDQGKDLDWFSSTEIVILSAVAAIGFAAWLIWELTEKHPIVDLSLFKNRNFALGTLAFCLGYAVFFEHVAAIGDDRRAARQDQRRGKPGKGNAPHGSGR